MSGSRESVPGPRDARQEFAVCDAWFSSVPGETWPNRNFAHAATSDRATNIEAGFYYDPTVFEQLASAGATWRVYHDGPPQLWCFRRLWQEPSWLDRLLKHRTPIANWYTQDDFYEHLRAGDLPSYSFIEPRHMILSADGGPQATNSQHPNNNRTGPADFYAGEELIRTVYDSIAARPSLFQTTLLVITYDEHGGFYDHARPPSAQPPGDPVWRGWSRRILRWLHALGARMRGQMRAYRDDFPFDVLGVRVPAVLVSPWIRPGSIVHTQLEHASIPATLRALFAPGLPSLTHRDRSANTFHQVVREHGLSAPRNPISVPPAHSADGTQAQRAGQERGPAGTAAKAHSDFQTQLSELSRLVSRELAPRQPERPTRPSSPGEEAASAAAHDVATRFASAAQAARTRNG